jgi:dephospho-CoA kinase
MLKVGITGGIGSGKSTVCQVFTTLGIPVFNADTAARYLIENDAQLIKNITGLFGEQAYINKKLNSKHISEVVFTSPEKLQQLNALTHPATIAYGQKWMTSQNTPYIIKEAAIFFETGSNKDMDVMVGVSAPLELRINRAMQRGHSTREQIAARIQQQMPQEEKMKLCNHVIINDDVQAIIPQVLALHQLLVNKAGKSI